MPEEFGVLLTELNAQSMTLLGEQQRKAMLLEAELGKKRREEEADIERQRREQEAELERKMKEHEQQHEERMLGMMMEYIHQVAQPQTSSTPPPFVAYPPIIIHQCTFILHHHQLIHNTPATRHPQLITRTNQICTMKTIKIFNEDGSITICACVALEKTMN